MKTTGRILLMILMLFTLGTTVSASTEPFVYTDSDKGLESLVKNANAKYKSLGYSHTIMSKSGKQVFFHKSTYDALTVKEKREVMAEVLGVVSSSPLSGRDKSRVYNFVEELDEGTAMAVRQLSEDVTVELGEASNILNPFTGIVGVVLGVISILTFMFLSITVLIDVIFLTIPFFQAFAMRDDNIRPKYISQEAYDAVLVSESQLGTGSNSMWGTYMKNKVKTFIIVGITLAYLISGQIFDLATFIIDVFLGFFGK